MKNWNWKGAFFGLTVAVILGCLSALILETRTPVHILVSTACALMGFFAGYILWTKQKLCDECKTNSVSIFRERCNECSKLEDERLDATPEDLANKEPKINCRNGGTLMDKVIIGGDIIVDVCPTCKYAYLDDKEFVIIEDRLKRGSGGYGCLVIVIIFLVLWLLSHKT